MIGLTTRTKSVALAFAMIVSSNNSSCFSNPFAGMGSYLNIDKKTMLVAAVAVGLVAKVRLDTKPRGTYDYGDIQADILELLNSYNIFDATSRATIMNFVDKYLVGAKFRLDEQTTRTKAEDGSVVTIKRNKVAQKPSGAMGLFDAYVLQQLKVNNELLPVAAAMFCLIVDPQGTWLKTLSKHEKAKEVDVVGN
jgi:hypothetical protein